MLQPDVVAAPLSAAESASTLYERETSSGVQVYEEPSLEQSPDDSAGRPLMHASALKQATGEAVYVDDMPPRAGLQLINM